MAVEFATLIWVDWFNNRRLLEPIGNIPPAEAEERYYAMLVRGTRGGSSNLIQQTQELLGPALSLKEELPRKRGQFSNLTRDQIELRIINRLQL